LLISLIELMDIYNFFPSSLDISHIALQGAHFVGDTGKKKARGALPFLRVELRKHLGRAN
jgi:hypothetical protein